MAVLSDALRAIIWADFMRDNTGTVSVTKDDLRAAVNALDQWLDDNASSANQAIPLPARTALSAAQKARILAYIALKRWAS